MPHKDKQMASFFLTTKCNLRCEYCYNSKQRERKNEQTLSEHIAKAGIDYFFSTNPSRHIRFYGPGEPTQEFNLLKNIVEYARQKAGSELSTEIQTNGCFNKDVCKWILDNINIVWISFDGTPEIHDKNRHYENGIPSSPTIERNVKWLIENKCNQNIMVGARVTITDANVNKQKEIVDYFYSLGITNIWTDPIFPSVDEIPVFQDEEKKKQFHFDMDKYVDNYIEAYYYGKSISVFYGSFLACNFDGVCNTHCRACTPTPHFTSDGYVSACDLVTFGNAPHHMECFVYGKWDEEANEFKFDYDKIKRLQLRTTDNIAHCRKCPVKEHCGGYCLGEVMNETGKLDGQKEIACYGVKKLFSAIGNEIYTYRYFHP